MTESKFKEGDTVFYPPYGFQELRSRDDYINPYVFELVSPFKNSREFFTIDGKLHECCVNPSLFTLEEAKLLGYEPPKKKVKKRGWISIFKGYGFNRENFVCSSNIEETKEDSLINKTDVVDCIEIEFEVEE